MIFYPQATYVMTDLFPRMVGGAYLIAFLSLLVQVEGLFGSRGILPMAEVRERVKKALGWRGIRDYPSLFLWRCGDGFQKGCALAGALLSSGVVMGFDSPFAFIALYILYLSFVSLGQEFLSFQWDALLLETGFMTIFLTLAPVPPLLAVIAFRFFVFRFMFSAGWVKLSSGDPTWRDLTAMCHHYQTQPLPNRVSWFAHHLPVSFQKLSTLGTFAIELGVPFLALGTSGSRLWGFVILTVFQLLLQLTGSYGFFNILTFALTVTLLDDQHIPWIVPSSPDPVAAPWMWLLNGVFALFILLNALQLLRLFLRPPWTSRITAFLAPWSISNPYGLFAVMTTARYELVIEGSKDGNEWRTYEFRWKPGDPFTPPRQAAPHQPRLDWQMWFAALRPRMLEPWVVNLLLRLLEGSPPVLGLLRENPFPETPPHQVRVMLYRYRFSTQEERKKWGTWWERELVGRFPPLSLEDLLTPSTGASPRR